MHIEEMQVRIRAYEIWEFEGCPHGRDLVHWFQAMSELDALAAGALSSEKSTAQAGTTAPAKAKNTTRSTAKKPKVALVETLEAAVTAKTKAAPKAKAALSTKAASSTKAAKAAPGTSAAKAPRRAARQPQITLN